MLLTSEGRPGHSSGIGRRRILACLVLSAILLTVSTKTTMVKPLEHAAYQLVYEPIRGVVHFPLRLMSLGLRDFRANEDLQSEIVRLRDENRLLHAQTQTLGHYQAENRRLRMLMDAVPDVRVPVSVAELLDTSIDGYREIVTISRGSNDGVYQNQAVIDPYGLVGQVVEVFPNEARVMLISDARSRVPVYNMRTQQRAVVAGSAEAGALSLPDMPMGTDIQQGDVLISSGLGGVFPRGYPVAEVAKVIRDPRLSFMSVKLKPAARLSAMLEVLLLDQPEHHQNDSAELQSGPPVPLPVPSSDATTGADDGASEDATEMGHE